MNDATLITRDQNDAAERARDRRPRARERIPSNPMAELSAYELERAENMRRNFEVLASLGLVGRDKPIPSVAAAAPKAKRPKRPPPPRREPTRKSSRIVSEAAPDMYIDADMIRERRGLVSVGGAHASKAAHITPAADVNELEPDDDDFTPVTEDDLHPNERTVYAVLRDEKNQMARELDTAAYHVAQNRALMTMVRRVPTSASELLDCWGWGEAKVHSFGERLLGALRPHADALLVAKEARREAKASGVSALAEEEDDEDVPLQLRKKPACHGATSGAAAGSAASAGAADEDEVLEADDDDDASPAAFDPRRMPLPERIEDLLPHEEAAFQAVLEWKRARARELGYNDPCGERLTATSSAARPLRTPHGHFERRLLVPPSRGPPISCRVAFHGP